MHFLPQTGQAAGEQPIGLLAGVLADQLNLAQRLRQILFGQGRQTVEQCFGAA